MRKSLGPSAMTQELNSVLEERGKRYGKFTDHAQVTQELKQVITNHTPGQGFDYDVQEALDMIMHKVGRIVAGDPNYDDSWRDIAGYAMLVCNRINNIQQ